LIFYYQIHEFKYKNNFFCQENILEDEHGRNIELKIQSTKMTFFMGNIILIFIDFIENEKYL
jgi:hypothetical protein